MNRRKRLYHISYVDFGPMVKFKPRIPDNRYDGETVYHPYAAQYLEENATIKRICVSDSVKGCFKAVPFDCDDVYVYSPKNPVAVTRDMPVMMVPDARQTGEHWILEPTIMVKIGEIKILQRNFSYVTDYIWKRRFYV